MLDLDVGKDKNVARLLQSTNPTSDHLRERFHAKALRAKLGVVSAAALVPMAAEFAATAGKPIQSAKA